MSRSKKQLILDTLSDMLQDFLYYDRRDDSELLRGDIEEAVADGDITIEDMVKHFEKELKENI